jgi:hypothetical protein
MGRLPEGWVLERAAIAPRIRRLRRRAVRGLDRFRTVALGLAIAFCAAFWAAVVWVLVKVL